MSNKKILKLQKLAVKGDLTAKLLLARYYVWGDETKPVPPNKAKKAVQYLKDCIKRGNALAMLSVRSNVLYGARCSARLSHSHQMV